MTRAEEFLLNACVACKYCGSQKELYCESVKDWHGRGTVTRIGCLCAASDEAEDKFRTLFLLPDEAVCSWNTLQGVEGMGREVGDSVNPQEAYWRGNAGAAYHRNWDLEPAALDTLWLDTIAGVRRSELNREFLALCPEARTLLAVGCGCGNQLAMLDRDTDLACRGLEICTEAVGRARERGFAVSEGRVGDKVVGADIVTTNGVLSHIPRLALPDALSWLRGLGRWIWCWEYYQESLSGRARKARMDYLWAGPYCDMLADGYKVVERRKTKMPKVMGEMFLLERIG